MSTAIAIAEVERLLQDDRADEALSLVEQLWNAQPRTPSEHHALASQGMIAAYTIADYARALTWLERTRIYAGPEAQPFLGLLAATFKRLDVTTDALVAALKPARSAPTGDTSEARRTAATDGR